MSRFEDWEPPLQHMRGGPARLLGIDIYYDFRWREIVTHGMRQFAHGQRLAELAVANCGEKTPALILTSNEQQPAVDARAASTPSEAFAFRSRTAKRYLSWQRFGQDPTDPRSRSKRGQGLNVRPPGYPPDGGKSRFWRRSRNFRAAPAGSHLR